MARLAETVQRALGSWWDLALAAGFGGYTTTDTVAAAADLAGQLGRSVSFEETSAIAVLFGYARRMSNAADVLQSLGREDVIGPDAIGVPPWARDEREMATFPIWHVHFDFTWADENGNLTTERRVDTFRMTLPDTIGELQDALTADAEAMAAKYEVSFVSADLRQIHAV